MGSQNPVRVYALVAGIALTLGATVTTSHAQPAERNAALVDVAVGAGGPLTALSITSGSLNCAQGRVVVGKNGKMGFLAPVVGPNVLRGSTDSGSAVSWAVIPLEDASPDMLNAVTTCLSAR